MLELPHNGIVAAPFYLQSAISLEAWDRQKNRIPTCKKMHGKYGLLYFSIYL
ncbi:hypothetical protein C1A50_0903 [Paenibacillus polymyxa]|nr:hypothetical protein C1A50_0903 [Paenibacillus polymyxa]